MENSDFIDKKRRNVELKRVKFSLYQGSQRAAGKL
jgi:hypothetical protein